MALSITNPKLSPVAAAAGLSSALLVLFVGCAILQMIAPGLQLSHGWIGLFTSAPLASMQAWVEGIVGSIAFGIVGGATFAYAYNMARRKGF